MFKHVSAYPLKRPMIFPNAAKNARNIPHATPKLLWSLTRPMLFHLIFSPPLSLKQTSASQTGRLFPLLILVKSSSSPPSEQENPSCSGNQQGENLNLRLTPEQTPHALNQAFFLTFLNDAERPAKHHRQESKRSHALIRSNGDISSSFPGRDRRHRQRWIRAANAHQDPYAPVPSIQLQLWRRNH